MRSLAVFSKFLLCVDLCAVFPLGVYGVHSESDSGLMLGTGHLLVPWGPGAWGCNAALFGAGGVTTSVGTAQFSLGWILGWVYVTSLGSNRQPPRLAGGFKPWGHLAPRRVVGLLAAPLVACTASMSTEGSGCCVGAHLMGAVATSTGKLDRISTPCLWHLR